MPSAFFDEEEEKKKFRTLKGRMLGHLTKKKKCGGIDSQLEMWEYATGDNSIARNESAKFMIIEFTVTYFLIGKFVKL